MDPGTPTRIVVVEDEVDLRRSMVEYLTLQGFDAHEAADGVGLTTLLAEAPADIVLLDLRLPGEDGLSLLRTLRQQGDTPVIMVTAMGDPVDRIVGLEIGADDYVVKPFEFRELLARIRTVLRRTRATGGECADHSEFAEPDEVVRVGRARLDRPGRRLLDENGDEVPLTTMEFDLLNVFIDRPNRVLTRDQLLDLAHNDSWSPFDRSIDIRIARLRKKIEPDVGNPTVIRTVRGAGYKFVP